MAMQIELKWEVLLGKGWERGEEKRKREEKEERGKILPPLRRAAEKEAGMAKLISSSDLLHLSIGSRHSTLGWLGYCRGSSCQVTGDNIMTKSNSWLF